MRSYAQQADLACRGHVTTPAARPALPALPLVPQGQELPPLLADLYEESLYALQDMDSQQPHQDEGEAEGGQGRGSLPVPGAVVPPLKLANVRQLLLEALEALVVAEEGKGEEGWRPSGRGKARAMGAKREQAVEAGASSKAASGRRGA